MLKWKCKCTACADYNELKKYNCKSKDMLILCLKLQLDKANAQLQKGNIPNVNRCWVDCNEKLPDLIKDKDYSENVLAWCNNQLLIMCLFWVNGVDEHDSGYIWCQSYYIDGEGQSDDEYAPTHWMPLPKEPSVC